MKFSIFLGLCSLYTVSSFVVTVPIEYVGLDTSNEKFNPDANIMDNYRYNSPDSEVEVFSPSVLQQKEPSFDSNDVNLHQPFDEVIPFVYSAPRDTGIRFNDWNVSPPDFPMTPDSQISRMFPERTPNDNYFTSQNWFDNDMENTQFSLHGTIPQEVDDSFMTQNKVIVNGVPTDLSQEVDDSFEDIYQDVRIYQWLIRYCKTHPRCDAQALMELILSIPQEANKGFQHYYPQPTKFNQDFWPYV